MQDPNEKEVPEVIEEVEEEAEEEAPEPTDDINELKNRIKSLEEKHITTRERRRADKVEIARLKRLVETKSETSSKSQDKKSGELDDTQLDYLDLKGITEDEDIAVVQKVMARTGMTVRQALKDDYVAKKLEANKAQRELQAATPSSTKRSGSQQNDLAAAIAKYEASGFKELPADFDLRAQVVDAVMNRTSVANPPWRK